MLIESRRVDQKVMLKFFVHMKKATLRCNTWRKICTFKQRSAQSFMILHWVVEISRIHFVETRTPR